MKMRGMGRRGSFKVLVFGFCSRRGEEGSAGKEKGAMKI